MAKSMNMARFVAERVIANLESTITIDTSFSMPGTTSVSVWSVVVKWSISLPSDSVALVGSFIVVAEVVKNEPSGMVDAIPLIIVVGSVLVPPDVVKIYVSSIVDIGVVFDVTVADGLTSVVLTGSLVNAEVVKNELSGMVDAIPLIVVVGRVRVSPDVEIN